MVVAPAWVPVRGAGGVSSRVECQRASGRTSCAGPGSSSVPASSGFPSGGRWGGGTGGPGGGGVVRGALLGPEATGPVLPLAGGSGCGVSGFPASCRWSWSRAGRTTSVWGVWVVV